MSKNYWADSIEHLEGLEHIFKRPEMYIWDRNDFWLHHIFQEPFDNCLDEALAWFATEVKVTLYKDNSISIEDNWRWVPVWWNSKSKIDSLELVTWTVNTSWKYTKWEDAAYKISGWLHWIWIKATNAVSEFFECHSYSVASWEKDKKDWSIRYEERKIVWWVTDNWKTKRKWTWIHFKPSEEIFWKLKYKPSRIGEICEQQAYLLPWLKIIFTNDNNWKTEEFYYWGWSEEYLSSLLWKNDLAIESPLKINIWKDENKWTFEWFDSVLFFTKKWTRKYKEYRESFANNIETVSWWPHVSSYETWILNAFKDFAIERKYKEKDVKNITAKDILFNVFYVINIKIVDVAFVWQTKDKLANREILAPLRNAVYNAIYIELLKNPNEYEMIVDRAIELVQARNKASEFNYDEFIESIKEENWTVWRFLWKLKKCKNRKAKNKELFIIEWDSAEWPLLKTRLDFQECLPLKWVPMNIEERIDRKTWMMNNRVFNNEEYRTIISAFGWDILDNFDEKKFDYEKIIIMADSDVDGAHIFYILLNGLYRLYWLEFINKYVYVSQLPLFQIMHKWKRYLFLTNKEKEEFCEWKEINQRDISRFKWLWEVPSKLFRELAMDPDTRWLTKIHWENEEEIEDMFYTILWKDAQLRKEFLAERDTKYLNNL